MITVVDIADSEIKAGAREIGGNNQGPFVEKYLNANHPERITHQGEPWCAAFYLWCWLQIGPIPFPFTRSSHILYERMPWSSRVLTNPQPGDALFWNYHKDGNDSPSHVNMVHHVDSAGVIYTVGGNEGDESSGAPVKIKPRHDLSKFWGMAKRQAM